MRVRGFFSILSAVHRGLLAVTPAEGSTSLPARLRPNNSLPRASNEEAIPGLVRREPSLFLFRASQGRTRHQFYVYPIRRQ